MHCESLEECSKCANYRPHTRTPHNSLPITNTWRAYTNSRRLVTSDLKFCYEHGWLPTKMGSVVRRLSWDEEGTRLSCVETCLWSHRFVFGAL